MKKRFNPFKYIEEYLIEKAKTNKKGAKPFKDKKIAKILVTIEILLVTPFFISLISRKFLVQNYFINSDNFMFISLALIFLIVIPARSIFKIGHSWSKENKSIDELKENKTILFLRSFSRDHFEEDWESLLLGFFQAKAIALGDPTEYFEPLGKAERIYIEKKENWKKVITDLAKNSEGIIIRIDSKKNLVWEIEHLLKYFPSDHILLYSPPPNNKEALALEYETFIKEVNPLFPKGLPEFSKPYRSLLIGFNDEWDSKFLKVPFIVKLADRLGKLTLRGLGDEIILKSQLRQILKKNFNYDFELFGDITYSLGASLFKIFIIFFIGYALYYY